MSPRVLFICKNRINTYGNSIGLYNSALFVAIALEGHGIESKVECVHDNNCIDKVVTEYNPTHVIIEALWVVPSKIHELLSLKRHKSRQWYIRIHSKMPFLSMEGIAIKWIREYIQIKQKHHNLHLSANNYAMVEDLKNVLCTECEYMPNVYPLHDTVIHTFLTGLRYKASPDLHIGCFGAIRPLKNTLIQAIAAIEFADFLGKKLYFHINGNRSEQKGEEVLKNIQALFPIREHELVMHDWMNHNDFIDVVKSMDVGMQVSFSESFNIVIADFVSNNIPVVGSSDIEWISTLYQAQTNSVDDILRHLKIAWYGRRFSIQTINYMYLGEYNKRAYHHWLNLLFIHSQ